jgi:hypothetical protein
MLDRQDSPQRWLAAVITGCFLWLAALGFAPPASALTPIKLSNLAYHDCPPEMAEGTVSSRSSQKAKCFLITATATLSLKTEAASAPWKKSPSAPATSKSASPSPPASPNPSVSSNLRPRALQRKFGCSGFRCSGFRCSGFNLGFVYIRERGNL